ncbi:MAG: UV DNA damage repair endonuclease UvsE [Oculatellaceae cyanobacterium bins.114]|nr:UV DNA damage repair endonuclease UvsE [Oculatellaceae cyanobacterium bins.114]
MNEPYFKQPELGLVCITASEQVRFKTMTRKRLLQFTPIEQANVLRDLYAQNLRRLDAAISFCEQEQIHLYRLISGLFPFADDSIGADVLTEFVEGLAIVGTRAIAAGIRLVLHPDQFVVLNSDRPDVIQNSIKILTAQARLFDLLRQPRSPWALMNIHGGKGDRADRLVNVIRELPDAIRLRLTLENDEYAYGANQIAEVCLAAGIPMVFDAHHHAIHQRLETYEDPSVAESLALAKTTWQNPEWQLVHISNGAESFADPKHSDYITLMPSSYRNVPWIEIEAKQKERAIAQLREDWLINTFTARSTKLQMA